MSPILGTLYRKYLSGTDLQGEIITVKILDIFRVVVSPPPKYDEVEKWCLKVAGLADSLPDRIILGAKGEKQLIQIFGQVDTQQLIGRTIGLAPQKVTIAGRNRIAINFVRPANQAAAAPLEPEDDDDPDVVQYTDDDDMPF